MADKPDARWIVRVGAMPRITLALSAALLAFLSTSASVSWHARVLASWDAGAVTYLLLAWRLAFVSDAEMTRDHVLSQDLSGYLIFLFVVGASCACIVALGFVVGPIRNLVSWSRALHLVFTIAALVSSWLLIHTVFAFHYAHRFYAGPHEPDCKGPALEFPGGSAPLGDRPSLRDGPYQPDYMDFLYYSFVVGMTSQVADVSIASPSMRTLTMIHGILAFLFNVVVLALSINIFASVL